MLLVSMDLVTKPLSSVKYTTENLSMVTVIEELLLMMVLSLIHVTEAVGQLGWQVKLKLLPNITLVLALPSTTTVTLGTPTHINKERVTNYTLHNNQNVIKSCKVLFINMVKSINRHGYTIFTYKGCIVKQTLKDIFMTVKGLG